MGCTYTLLYRYIIKTKRIIRGMRWANLNYCFLSRRVVAVRRLEEIY
jgi:hypothetical protein